jgi:hypothetical protein
MAQRSGAGRITGALADATGRSDEEVRWALTVTVAAAALVGVLRFLTWLADLGSNVLSRTRR